MPRPSTSLGLSRSTSAFDGVRSHATPVPMNAPSWTLPLATTALLQPRASTPTQQRQRVKRSASTPDAAAAALNVQGAFDNQAALWPTATSNQTSGNRTATVHSVTRSSAVRPADLHSSVHNLGFNALNAQSQQWPVHSRAIVAQRATNASACSGCDAVRESLKRARAESRELRSLVFKLETAAMQGTAYGYGDRSSPASVVEHVIVNRMYSSTQSAQNTDLHSANTALTPSKKLAANDTAAVTAAAAAAAAKSDIEHAVATAKLKWDSHTQQLLAAKTAPLQQFITQQECQLSEQRQQHERHCLTLTRQHTVAQEQLHAEHCEQLSAMQQQYAAQLASAQQQAEADCQQKLAQLAAEHTEKVSGWQLQVAELQAQLQAQLLQLEAQAATAANSSATAMQQQCTSDEFVCHTCAQNAAGAVADNSTYGDYSSHASSQQSDASKLTMIILQMLDKTLS
jgi:trimeric autotransporter adhesin